MSTKGKELLNVATEDQLAVIEQEAPVERGFQRTFLPRISFTSQDKTEGKGKLMKVITEGGTYFTEEPASEGEWTKEEIGTAFTCRIIYARRQLRYWDNDNESFVSSPIYDTDEDVIPLFQDGKEIDRGTQKELQAKYPPQEGRKTSRLQDERVLYVVYEGKLYQMNIKGSSKWSFLTYVRKVNPATVHTLVSGEEKKNGQVEWNSITFSVGNPITKEEAEDTISKIRELKEAIALEKEHYGTGATKVEAAEVEKDW